MWFTTGFALSLNDLRDRSLSHLIPLHVSASHSMRVDSVLKRCLLTSEQNFVPHCASMPVDFVLKRSLLSSNKNVAPPCASMRVSCVLKYLLTKKHCSALCLDACRFCFET